MIASSIGQQTSASHLRVVVNPQEIERTTPQCDRSSLSLIVNPEFGRPQFVQARTWLEELVDDLARRTCNGTIAKGTFRYINHYPTPAVLNAANELLAQQGIKMDINPYASEDGTIMVWMEYTRQPGFSS